ncbi:ROK family transcriptional regulator [Corynebacterium sp. CCM 9185]|uniref:ROK family transcriptional regulator n=1 Tax=Corynebacterium marambiense TaxID=2765364 RepID=A0ABS0VSK4_9CORY|nr:ROK family transcriptional regulator [Corynebacterium marambiense]MBI8999761.1 ROK family transcriptional regulator [Corynebacterium marambiense]MCK7662601.1 ROK family transcriptional regulator [Corynebacterium marambiense]MCX7543609.1 MarR family transcriptional regulator [Corynebacterium marambiense]
MSTLAVSAHTPAFRRPTMPTARCLHHMMRGHLAIRGDLVAATGLSQPTVTRAVTSLVGAGLIHERPDLVRAAGPGRPRIPLEMAPTPWLHIGAAITEDGGTLGFFDTRGRILRETTFPLGTDTPDTAEHLIAGIHRLLSRLAVPVADIGVAATAPHTGFLGERLTEEFGAPVTVGDLTASLAAAELLTTDATTDPILIIHLDRGLTLAVANDNGVTTHPVDSDLGPESLARHLTNADILPGQKRRGFTGLLPAETPQSPELRLLLDERARELGETVARLTQDTGARTVVLAGPGFTVDPDGYRKLAATVNPNVDKRTAIRIIPDAATLARAAARTVALDRLLSDPVAVHAGLVDRNQL